MTLPSLARPRSHLPVPSHHGASGEGEAITARRAPLPASAGEGRALLLIAALTIGVRAFTGPHPVDDAYITFRYAQNLADGLGLVYNPGQAVLGTTTPLWAALLALFYRLGATDLPWVATVLAALCDGASAFLLVLLGRRLGWPLSGALLLGLAWALNPPSVAFATGGMETSLFVLVALGALSLAATDRWAVAAALAGTGVLVRPESAILAGVVVAWAFWRQRRVPVRALLACAVPVLAIGAGLLLWYGTPIPQSVLAKQVAYQEPGAGVTLLAFVLQAVLPGWSTFLLSAQLPTFGILTLATVGLVLLVAVSWLAVRVLRRRSAAWLPFVGFGVLYVLFYLVGSLHGGRVWPWYLVPLVPLYLLLGAAGLAALRPSARPWLAGALLLWQLPAVDWHQPFLPAGVDLRREAVYAQIGAELRQDLPPTALVAAPEIGALGYYSHLRILDTVGLVSPEALPYYPPPSSQIVSDNAIPAALIRDAQPDAVVTLDEFARLSLLPDPSFQSSYRLVHAYDLSIWASQHVLVYERVSPPATP